MKEGRGGPLALEALGDDPIQAFRAWFDDARARTRSVHPNAVSLATVDERGHPRSRIVLLKGVDSRGFIFYTNYQSAKGRELERTPRAALTFYWGDLARQVRATGSVERVPAGESDAYFRTRPRGSQIGAWASPQSEPVESREVLEARAREIEAEYEGREVPRPPHWGGLVLHPDEIEFWQEARNRLHDRILYERDEEGGWRISRLGP